MARYLDLHLKYSSNLYTFKVLPFLNFQLLCTQVYLFLGVIFTSFGSAPATNSSCLAPEENFIQTRYHKPLHVQAFKGNMNIVMLSLTSQTSEVCNHFQLISLAFLMTLLIYIYIYIYIGSVLKVFGFHFIWCLMGSQTSLHQKTNQKKTNFSK